MIPALTCPKAVGTSASHAWLLTGNILTNGSKENEILIEYECALCGQKDYKESEIKSREEGE